MLLLSLELHLLSRPLTQSLASHAMLSPKGTHYMVHRPFYGTLSICNVPLGYRYVVLVSSSRLTPSSLSHRALDRWYAMVFSPMYLRAPVGMLFRALFQTTVQLGTVPYLPR